MAALKPELDSIREASRRQPGPRVAMAEVRDMAYGTAVSHCDETEVMAAISEMCVQWSSHAGDASHCVTPSAISYGTLRDMAPAWM
jgi:hypothetical protein